MTSWNEIRRAASSSEAIWRPLPLSASSSASPCLSDLRVKESRDEIAAAAQAVLDARALYPAASLAELYDPLVMPPELVKAHARLGAFGGASGRTEPTSGRLRRPQRRARRRRGSTA